MAQRFEMMPLLALVGATHGSTASSIARSFAERTACAVLVVGDDEPTFGDIVDNLTRSAQDSATALCGLAEVIEALKRMKGAQPVYEPDDRQDSMAGIHDLRAWYDQRVRTILNFTRARIVRRLIFQPCWSSRRWKSLT